MRSRVSILACADDFDAAAAAMLICGANTAHTPSSHAQDPTLRDRSPPIA